ncbi:hypothetical protein KKC59_04305 [bacterium]|nr:hypothetical protein [bacterium]
MKKIFFVLLILLTSVGCAHNRLTKNIDVDENGVIEKIMIYEDNILICEEIDKDLDSRVDCIIHYNKDGKVSSVEHDIDNDGKIDAKDKYFEDMRSISYRDDNKDGKMDRSWSTFYSDKGLEVYVEYDLNNDGLIDSKIKLNRGLRENLINGVWMKEVEKDGCHGVEIDGVWQEIVFDKGKWVLK